METLEDRCTPAVLTVNSLADNTTAVSVLTLREAISVVDAGSSAGLSGAEQAQVSGTLGSNDTIQFDPSLAGGTITLTQGALDVTNPVTIAGPGAGNLTVNGNGSDRVFVVGFGFPQSLGLNVAISGLTVSGGSAAYGGGVLNFGTLVLGDDVLAHNAATAGDGGGVYNGGALTLTGCTLSGNNATSGGGLYNTSTGAVTLADCTVSANSVGGSGQGGGLYNSGGSLTVQGGSFTGNSAASDGGGLYTSSAGASEPVTIGNATFAGNASGSDGGAIRAVYGSIVTVTGCTFVGNSAASEGGALDGSGAARLAVQNSTFTNNQAGSIGGALNCGGTGSVVSFTNDTITGNRVGGPYGGGINIRCNSVTLENTLIAGNYQGSGATPNDIAGYDFSNTPDLLDPASSYNIIGPGGSDGLVNGANHNQVGVTALGLGSLADNGGPTQTMALLAGSPAIGAGSNAFVTPGETDQRGLPRVGNGTVDIGAFEVQSSAGAVLLVNSTADNTAADNVLTLREAIEVVDGTLGRPLTPGEQAQISGTLGPDDTIEFNLPSGATIALTGGALDITRPVAIFGPGAGALTISGNNADRVFIVGSGSSQNLGLNVSISDLTINGGRAVFGGGLANFGSLALGNVAFNSNTAGAGGGGAVYNDGALTVGGSTFSYNAATSGGPGGAIQNTSSASLVVVGCTFTGNTATGGGSGGGVANSGVLAVTGSTFVANAAGANGGGIFNAGAAATVTSSTLSRNFAASEGGGIFGATLIRVVNSTLTGNAPNNTAGLVDVTTASSRGIRARLLTRKVGRKKKLFVEVLFADTGARKSEFRSPFQKPAFKDIHVSLRGNNGDGVPDEVVVTARKGKRTMVAVFPA